MKKRLWGSLVLVAGLACLSGCSSSDGHDSSAEHTPASMTLVGRYAQNQVLDEAQAEIVAFHQTSNSILVINANDKSVDVLNVADLSSEALTEPRTASNIERSQQVDVRADVTAIDAGGINSVAVYGDLAAVAVENDDKQQPGVVAFYTLSAAGEMTFLKSVAAGALPDNVVFTPDGAYALAANEGEPADDYLVDPEGTVTIIAITDGIPADTGVQVHFSAEDCDSAVRLSKPGASAAQDLEPEYIAVSPDSTTAYVSLQENNAIAVIDIASASVDRVFGLAPKDHSVAGNGLDASNKDDAINITTYAHLYGLPMPDTIATFERDGVHYLVTANEGDAREYFFDVADEAACQAAGGLDYDEDDGCLAWIDEARVEDLTLDPAAFPDADIQDSDQLGRLKVVSTEGDTDNDGDYDVLYSFGTRSFSIWNADTGALVYDSGDDFEQISAQQLGYDGFNNTDNENDPDDRSDDKGPEPEALAIGKVNGHLYAFIGLERTGGIMVYDIEDPANPEFREYVFNRDIEIDIEDHLEEAGDLAPEGMAFVPAENSPTGEALLIVGNEVSGTTAVYEIK